MRIHDNWNKEPTEEAIEANRKAYQRNEQEIATLRTERDRLRIKVDSTLEELRKVSAEMSDAKKAEAEAYANYRLIAEQRNQAEAEREGLAERLAATTEIIMNPWKYHETACECFVCSTLRSANSDYRARVEAEFVRLLDAWRNSLPVQAPEYTLDFERELRAARARLGGGAKNLIHFAKIAFTAMCGADVPNQATSTVSASVNCPRCVLALNDYDMEASDGRTD